MPFRSTGYSFILICRSQELPQHREWKFRDYFTCCAGDVKSRARATDLAISEKSEKSRNICVLITPAVGGFTSGQLMCTDEKRNKTNGAKNELRVVFFCFFFT